MAKSCEALFSIALAFRHSHLLFCSRFRVLSAKKSSEMCVSFRRLSFLLFRCPPYPYQAQSMDIFALQGEFTKM